MVAVGLCLLLVAPTVSLAASGTLAGVKPCTSAQWGQSSGSLVCVKLSERLFVYAEVAPGPTSTATSKRTVTTNGPGVTRSTQAAVRAPVAVLPDPCRLVTAEIWKTSFGITPDWNPGANSTAKRDCGLARGRADTWRNEVFLTTYFRGSSSASSLDAPIASLLPLPGVCDQAGFTQTNDDGLVIIAETSNVRLLLRWTYGVGPTTAESLGGLLSEACKTVK